MNRKPRHEPYDWIRLKSEWIKGEATTLQAFFTPLGISANTWQKKTKGWRRVRARYQDRIFKKAMTLSLKIEAKKFLQGLK